MSKAKKEWLICLKSIVFASLATAGSFVISASVIASVLVEIENRSIRNVIIYAMLMVIYAIFLYRFHMYNRLATYAEHTDKFDPKKELIAYIHAEGKIMFVIYGIAAAVTELSALIMQNEPQNPIAFATMFCLGPWIAMALKIPVLRSVIAFAYSAAVICLLTILRSRKIHKEETLIQKK